MKLWKDLFRTHILERGLNYYEEGYVTSLEKTLAGEDFGRIYGSSGGNR